MPEFYIFRVRKGEDCCKRHSSSTQNDSQSITQKRTNKQNNEIEAQ